VGIREGYRVEDIQAADLHREQDICQDLIGRYEVVGVRSGVMLACITTTTREERGKVSCIPRNERGIVYKFSLSLPPPPPPPPPPTLPFFA
jgi:hypothetical protein